MGSSTETTRATPATPAHPTAPGTPRTVPLASIYQDARTWPRQDLDVERVNLFAELYANGDPVPPVELFAVQYNGEKTPRFVLVDGWHRVAALKKIRAASASAIIRDDLHSLDDAYMAACEHSATSSKPLSSKEKRAAVRRILKTQPKISDRQIARIVGCSHTTVQRERNPLRRALGTAGDAMLGNGATAERSGPRSIEERAMNLLTSPQAQAPSVDTLTYVFRHDRAARAAAYRWVRAIVVAYDATAPVAPAPSGASTDASTGAIAR